MPLSLSDDEYSAVLAAAAPIHPLQRDDFLRTLAGELERHPVVGPGLVHRWPRTCSAAMSSRLGRRPRAPARRDIFRPEPRTAAANTRTGAAPAMPCDWGRAIFD
jgi:hypothetical protein